jgi:hypothetical protein
VRNDRSGRQYVSGKVFGTFGLQLALGRLLTQANDCNYPIRLLLSARAAET